MNASKIHPRLTWPLLLVLAASAWAQPQSLVCDGILGNSGQQGPTLVRFGNVDATMRGPIYGGTAAGMGVAYDRYGSLWDRGGIGMLNRYAPDGRLLAQYRIAPEQDGRDQLALAGDTLVLLIRGQLYTLSIDAPPDSQAKPLNRQASCISHGSVKGRIAVLSNGRLYLLDPTTGQAQDAGQAPDADWIDLAPDGAIYVSAKGKVAKFASAQPVIDGWPRGSPGERMQFLNGAFFGHAWHGTVRRFDAELQPDPGVVLGGASGSFIGHLDQNSELSNGRGMAHLRDDLYAVSGFGGVMHLLRWDGQKRQMEIIRRIGAAPFAQALGLNRQGNVWWHFGAWKWDDAPDTPMRLGANTFEVLGQAVMLEDDTMVVPGWMWGKPAFYWGPLHAEVKHWRIEGNCALVRNPVGSAAYREGDKPVLLVIDPAGNGGAFELRPDGAYRAEAGPVKLITTSSVKQYTALAMKNPDTLLAAGDGQVIEFARQGRDWKEQRRWNAWGEDHFGGQVTLCADDGRLWVSDAQRHRVLVFDLRDGRRLAAFGQTDRPGDDLAALNHPGRLTARGLRAVIHDAGNQRLVKLTLR